MPSGVSAYRKRQKATGRRLSSSLAASRSSNPGSKPARKPHVGQFRQSHHARAQCSVARSVLSTLGMRCAATESGCFEERVPTKIRYSRSYRGGSHDVSVFCARCFSLGGGRWRRVQGDPESRAAGSGCGGVPLRRAACFTRCAGRGDNGSYSPYCACARARTHPHPAETVSRSHRSFGGAASEFFPQLPLASANPSPRAPGKHAGEQLV